MGTIVVGLAGGTASGKSTISKQLAVQLGDEAQLIAHDRYYHSLHGHFDPHAYNFDHPAALHTGALVEHLDRLLAGQAVRLPSYDFSTHQRRDEVVLIHPRPILIVEGILVLCEPRLRERFDLSIFVYAPDDIRLLRRVRRDALLRGRDVAEILDQYEATVGPMHAEFVEPSRRYADLQIDGTQPIESNVQRVLEAIRASE